MSLEDNKWYNSFVMNAMGDTRFFVIIEKGITAILNNRNIEIGTFYEVQVAFNQKFEEHHRARHLVIQFREIDSLAEVRVESFGSSIGCFIKTVAELDGFVDTPNGRRRQLFNDTFGVFIDLDNIVKGNDNGERVEFEFKCISSPVCKTKSIFVPKKILGYLAAPARTEVLVGIVRGSFRGEPLPVWTKKYKDDIVLSEKRFPVNEDVDNRWIEMVVNDRLEVIETVRIVRDEFRTKVIDGQPEMLIECRYDGDYDQNGMKFQMFTHPFFGFIANPDNISLHPDRDGYCRAWIVWHKIPTVASRWKISCRDQAPSVSQVDHVQHNVAVQEHNIPEQISSSSGDHNDSQNRSRTSSSTQHQFPSRNKPNREQSLSPVRFHQPADDARGHHSAAGSHRSSQSSQPFSKPFVKSENPDSPVLPFTNRPRENVPHSESSRPDSTLDGFSEHSDEEEEDVAPGYRRQVGSSSYASESDFAALKIEEPRTPSHSVRVSEPSTYGTPLADISSPDRVPRSSENTRLVSESGEVAELKRRLQRACDLMDFFTKDTVINKLMRHLDMEHFHELSDIIRDNLNR